MEWETIVADHDDDSLTQAEIANICYRVTNMIDLECDQVLRATIDTEQLDGPSDRLVILRNSLNPFYPRRVRALLSRWPVQSIQSIKVALADSFPWAFQAVTDGHWGVRHGSLDASSGAGPAMIEFAPGYISAGYGQSGYVVQIEYVNGWPHSGLTQAALPNDSALLVDDVTGMAGATVTVFDGARTEIANVLAAVPAGSPSVSSLGPGSLTLAQPLANGHDAGILVTAMPGAIQQAAIYFAADIALSRGATAIGIPTMSGAPREANMKAPDFRQEAQALLQPFKRIL